ncbi:MAG: hypothetical protein KF852_01380 [Saprospiraceae bacterium]|nr:hypothetical protein [Saprospiraceae bacterium]
MSVAELKNDLIQLAIETDNPTVLEKVIGYFHTLQDEEDWWDALSPDERAFIENSSLQINEGEIVGSADVRKEARQILNN